MKKDFWKEVSNMASIKENCLGNILILKPLTNQNFWKNIFGGWFISKVWKLKNRIFRYFLIFKIVNLGNSKGQNFVSVLTWGRLSQKQQPSKQTKWISRNKQKFPYKNMKIKVKSTTIESPFHIHK